jgi:predicted dehydrogenase
MNSSKIQWGIIGCGDVTEVKSGPAFNKVPNSKLVAVMRRNAAKARDYAERHGVGKWYSDAKDLIGDPDVNAVYVATPPGSHEQYAIQAMRAGKPVYLEKPMALNARAAARIASMAHKTKVKLSVAHYRRRQPLFLKIKSLLQEQAIGEARLVNLQLFQPHQSAMIAQTEENWRLDPAISGGGLFYDLAPHQLDLMLYFFGTPRQAAGLSFNASGLYGADDTTSGQVIFESNVIFNGAWSFTVPERRDVCEVIGTEGKLRFSVFDQQPLVLERQGKESRFEFSKLPHVQQPMIEKVVEYFLGQSPNPCSAEEGVEVMRMMEAFTRKGKVVGIG